jgi:hypothetical protein
MDSNILVPSLLLALCLPLFVWVFSFIGRRLVPGYLRHARQQAHKDYRECLQKLKEQPGNPALLELTKEAARFYVNESRDDQGESQIDQVGLRREINEAFNGLARKAS